MFGLIYWGNFGRFFSTHLPSVFLYPSIGVTLAVIVIGLLLNSVKDKMQFVLWTLLLEYVVIVVCSTVVFRHHMSIARLEPMPFWTYIAVISHTPGVSVWDIILNAVLFIPLGLLVKLLYPSISLLKMLGIAVICSLFIETNQYLFEKGIAQFDDVMHNTIGCALGWGIAKCCLRWNGSSIKTR